ncbi:hypothetical protein Bca52824_092303 [Brassica carinata]|uniref:ADP-ribosyl cyclase/cyclic ADP-ribose hydrolase n=1 Tax=Brassica carinata TaxID=52824 RepID=A0A8X7TFJ2_BRACI|nr:hypothetical protein Bca52824_092303 [Brassica carinata]
MAASSTVRSVPKHQVFLNFRGELRYQFISHLAKALTDKNIQIFIDEDAEKGQPLSNLFKEIEKSRIALAVFSKLYTESNWCLDELERIKERTKAGELKTIPIFYNVDPKTVRYQTGEFGDALRKNEKRGVTDDKMENWKEALAYVSNLLGFEFDGKSNENTFINKIVNEVLQALNKIPLEESTHGTCVEHAQNTRGEEQEEEEEAGQICGLKQRLEELEETVDINGVETRIVQVVGMPGIGKTTLLKAFYNEWYSRFFRRVLLQNISGIVKQWGLERLPVMLLRELLGNDDIEDDGTYEEYKEKLCKEKVFIVLDGTSDETHIQVIFESLREWIKKGSKIVIATRAVSRDLVPGDDSMILHTYFVPLLCYRDGLKHFNRYAFDHQNKHDREAFTKVSKEVVRYARGHPQVLKILGEELRGKPLPYWIEKLDSLPQKLSPSIRDRVLQVTYDELSQEQKDAFLDIAFFRSHDLVYVKSLLDSSGPKATMSTIDALKDKFMIYISDSRVEMHDLLYTFAMEVGSEAYAKDGRGRHRIWHRQNKNNGDMLDKLRKRKGGGTSVRSFFLDLYDMKNHVTLGRDHLKKMRHLRYLKFYSSHCPQECEPKENIHIPDELELPLKEVRCLHWLNFPKDELPQDFIPENLVDLKLPYSKIKQIWNDEKAVPKLRWVDLNHSSQLDKLSGLSKAHNLERLNLEGCTALKTLPLDMQNMESLVFLNLKGCTSLESIPDINLKSLKILILSNCSSLKKFVVISKTLYALYLDGSAIKKLPTDMVKLARLVKLSMKDCKKLAKLPEGFDKMKDLQELVCSGCSKLSSLPDEMKNMKCLQILMLDGTAIKEIPNINSLQRLCLSGNDTIILLPGYISLLSQLKWLDLKHCKNLLSIPELPPNLQCLDAHGCESLRTVATPLATHLPSEQIHSTFIFTDCHKLDRTAKEGITTYAQRKCQFLSDALKRCNEGFVPEALFSICFPGCEVPSWFCHEAVGSELNLKLSPHWNENRFVGIALCVVISFPNGQEGINSFSVTCKFKLESKDGSRISFDRLVGSWNRHGKKSDKMANGKKQDKKMSSEHVFICYTRCSNNIKCLEEQCSDACTPTTTSLEFGVTDEKARVEVLKCGLRLVYASDEPQKTNSDVTDTTCEEIECQNLTPIRNGDYNV